MDRRVLAVDRHQSAPATIARRQYDLSAGDKTFLVGQCQPVPGVQGGYRCRKPGDSNDPVDDRRTRSRRQLHQRLTAEQHSLGQCLGQALPLGRRRARHTDPSLGVSGGEL